MSDDEKRANDGPPESSCETRYAPPAFFRRASWLRIIGVSLLGLATLLTLSGTVLIARSPQLADSLGTPLRQIGLLMMLVALVLLMVDFRLRIAAQRIQAIFEREDRDAPRPEPRGAPQLPPGREAAAAPSWPSRSSRAEEPVAPPEVQSAGRAVASATGQGSSAPGSLPTQEWLKRPAPRRGFPLLALFVLTAICAVLIGLVRPALQFAAEDAASLKKTLAAAGLGMIALGILGAIIGAFDERRATGVLLGILTGSALGILVGPIAIVPADRLPSLIGASIGGSVVILILAALARFGARSSKSNP